MDPNVPPYGGHMILFRTGNNPLKTMCTLVYKREDDCNAHNSLNSYKDLRRHFVCLFDCVCLILLVFTQ